MNLRIGIVGSHSVGKTTLARELAKRLDTVLIEEQIRVSTEKFAPFGFKSLAQITTSTWYPHFMFNILIDQVQQESSAQNGFVSDRTTLDYYAYYELLSHDPPETREIIKNLFLLRFQASYDLILYLPIAFEIINDGYRSMDDEQRHLADTRIQELLKPFQNVAALYEKTPEGRVQEAIGIVQSYQDTII